MTPTNKITIDCNGDDNKALADKLSRAEPGDIIEFSKVTAKLDEYQHGVAVLSIESIPVSGDSEEAAEVEEAPAAAAPAASVSLFKKKSKNEAEIEA